jgi:hypothetical protein
MEVEKYRALAGTHAPLEVGYAPLHICGQAVVLAQRGGTGCMRVGIFLRVGTHVSTVQRIDERAVREYQPRGKGER